MNIRTINDHHVRIVLALALAAGLQLAVVAQAAEPAGGSEMASPSMAGGSMAQGKMAAAGTADHAMAAAATTGAGMATNTMTHGNMAADAKPGAATVDPAMADTKMPADKAAEKRMNDASGKK